jgi:tetratricopeptide (TPR) repeat protein
MRWKLRRGASRPRKAERLLKENSATYRVSARIRWLVEISRVHILERTPSQARAPLSEAWTLAINSGEDDLAVETAQLIASMESQKVQQEWIKRGIELAEGSPLPKTKRWLGSLYASLGWKLYDVRQFENALETFQKALRHFKVSGTEREVFVAKWSIGKVLRAMDKTEEALSIQNALLAELGIGGARDGLLYEEIAECLQTLKRAPEAQLYFELAYSELSKDGITADNQPQRLKRMKDLGKVKN